MKNFFLYVMVAFYIFAGLNHFVNPGFYLKILPPWLPYPNFLVLTSGICEILFGLLLLPVFSRPFAAWAIIVLLIAIFPANLYMAIDYYHKASPGLWLTILRLPLQILLIYWAYIFTRV